MRAYLFRRLLTLLPLVVLVTFAVFMMEHLLPIDPVKLMINNEQGGELAPVVDAKVSQQEYLTVKHELGLDKPLLVQYGVFLYNAAHGNLGVSFSTRRTVANMIEKNAPATAELAVAGLFIAIVIGITLGVVAALRPNSWVDAAAMGFAVFGLSIPAFWLGIMLLLFFAVDLGWVPVLSTPGLVGLILPAFTLGVRAAAVLARLTRSSMIEVLGLDYVRTARAKGLRGSVVVIRHALKNSLIPVVTVVGLQFGGLLSGAVIIESVFGRPGLGSMTVTAILGNDFPLVQGAVLVISLSYLVVNFLVDLTYPLLDPRIRMGA